MKLIIDVPEEEYSTRQLVHYFGCYSDKLDLVIYNGTPLPKGYGRLIDADEFQKYCFNKNFDRRLSEGGLATINMFLELQPTVIESDKGGEE